MYRLLIVVLGLLVLATTGVHAAGIVVDNTTQTMSPKITFSSGLNIGGGSLSANGDMAYGSNQFQVRQNGVDTALAALDVGQTFSTTQTFTLGVSLNGGALFGSFTPTADGQMGYDGTNFLFREGGLNKVYTAANALNTWSALQTYSAGLQLGAFTPDTNGQIGWSGTDFLLRRGDANFSPVAVGDANTWTALQTLNGGTLYGTFTPDTNGEIGWSGTEFLFREGGVNKTLSTLAFSGDMNDTSNKKLSNSATSEPVIVADDDGLNISNAAQTQGATITGSGANELTIEGSVVHKSDDGVSYTNASGSEGARRRIALVTTTNSATPTELKLDNAGTKYLTIASGTTHAYSIVIACRATAGDNAGKSAMYRVDVVARNNSGTTALEGDVYKTVVAEGTAAWDVTAVADDTNDRLAVSVTGDAASTVKWRAYIDETTIAD